MLVCCALALVTCVVITPVSGASAQAVERAWVPPAYLMWRTGGLPTGLTPELDGLRGTEQVVVVSGDRSGCRTRSAPTGPW